MSILAAMQAENNLEKMCEHAIGAEHAKAMAQTLLARREAATKETIGILAQMRGANARTV